MAVWASAAALVDDDTKAAAVVDRHLFQPDHPFVRPAAADDSLVGRVADTEATTVEDTAALLP